jgi:uncharacterized protein (DUF2249 family)
MNRQHIIDARPILASGGCPFDTVIESGKKLNPGDGLTLIAPFNPLPLYEALQAIGFDYVDKCFEDEAFRVTFRFTPFEERVLNHDADLTQLEPPQPMVRAAEVLEQAIAGQTLRFRTRFKPMHLIESLEGKDCFHESREQEDGNWLTWVLKRGIRKCEH